MPWTAKVVAKATVESSRANVQVLFTDGVQYKRIETISLDGLTAEDFRRVVEAKRKGFENSYGFIDMLDPNFDLSLPKVLDKTQAQTDREIYFRLVMNRTNAINQGRPQQEIDDIQKVLDSLFRPEYL